MTIEEVKRDLAVIRYHAEHGDDEVAHVEEKRLWDNVLLGIATGEAKNPKEVAEEALKSKKIEFSRWFA